MGALNQIHGLQKSGCEGQLYFILPWCEASISSQGRWVAQMKLIEGLGQWFPTFRRQKLESLWTLVLGTADLHVFNFTLLANKATK